MSATEYNNLLYAICRKLDELNALDQLLSMCRGKLAPGSEGDIRNTRSLCDKLEENNKLGIDRLQLMKRLLRGVEDWALLEKVEKFECKRKEYKALLEKVISSLDALDDLERLIAICRGSVREGNIEDVRSLFRELENQENLEIDYLDVVKNILAETESNELLKELEEFEERRNREDKSEARKAQRAALMSSVRSTLVGVVNIKTVFKVVAGGLTVVSAMEVLNRWSSFDQLVAAVQTCVLPAGTRLVQITDGCVCLTVQAESLSALKLLWKLYQDGTLQKHLHDFFVTDEVRELADGEDVEVNVTIDEGEYQKACVELIQGAQGGATIDSVERRRRNSDSAVYFNAKELPLSRLECLETELKYLHNRITLLEEKNQNLGSHSSEKVEIAPSGSHDENFDYKLWDPTTMEKDTIKVESSEGRESKLTMKFWGAEKMDFVQRYIANVQETYSMTTEASDSGLGARTAASEEEAGDVRDSSTICVKDLREESIHEVDWKLSADRVGLERVFRFFGLKVDFRPSSRVSCMRQIAHSFPNTPVDLMRQCFEAFQMYDVVDLLEKAVKTISLRPVLSSGEVEALRTGNLPTKSHNNVVVLVVNESADKDLNQKIEGFFKELNSQNDVTVIGSSRSEEKLEEMRDLKRNQMDWKRKQMHVKQLREMLEIGKNHWLLTAKKRKLDDELFKTKFEIARLEKEIAMNKPLVEELLKENEETKTIITSTMDNWIQNQEKFTAIFLAFIIDEKKSIYDYDVLSECVASKLSSLLYHTKIVVGAPRRRIIYKVPEMLSIGSPGRSINSSIFNSMIEIFIKRYHKVDVVSMMRELLRTWPELIFERGMNDIQSNLSTLPSFEKRNEQELE